LLGIREGSAEVIISVGVKDKADGAEVGWDDGRLEGCRVGC
jgi:hypothetical protein